MTRELDLYKNILDEISDGVYCLDRDRRITYWNRAAERISGYKAEDVLGTCCAEDLLMHVSETGESLCRSDLCPAAKSIDTGCRQDCHEVFLHHKGGQRIPVHILTHPLFDEKGSIVGAVEIFKENLSAEQYRDQVERLRELALIDPLTNVGNRRYGEMQMESCLNEMKRYEWKYGVLFLDIDHFKQVNDCYGHDVGDAVLRMVANTLSLNVRSFDRVVRWGGEEFLITLVNIKEDDIQAIAEKIRVLVEKSFLKQDDISLGVTISIGATLCHGEDTRESLLKRADSLMYQSKEAGRNRVTVG